MPSYQSLLWYHPPRMYRPQDEDFATYYRSLNEAELQHLAANWHTLVPEAQAALRSEFSRRDLDFIEPPPVPDEDPVGYRDLVTLRQYRDLSEAIVARGVVESAGIFCVLKDENFVRLDWQMSNLIGGIRLQVPSDDAEAALAVLSQPIPESIAVAEEPEFSQPRCPRCNSVDVSWERQGRKAALISLYLFSLPLPRGGESWHCNACGIRWTDEEGPHS
jgi:hypothetical protein